MPRSRPHDGLVRSRRMSAVLILGCLGAMFSGGCGAGADRRLEKLFEARSMGSGRVLEIAPNALSDPEQEVRAAAAWMLGETGDPSAVTPLLQVLTDDSPGVRSAALKGLSAFSDPLIAEAVRPLVGDADPTVRLRAVEWLAQNDPDGSFEPLRLATRDGDADIRYAALRGLTAATMEDAVPELGHLLLTDSDWRVRAAAVGALAGREADEARIFLRLGTVDANPLVRDEARQAFETAVEDTKK